MGRDTKTRKASERMTGTDKEGSPKAIPIVGIGASAGGLAAFQEFFSHMPSDSGAAFVLLQHLEPNRESLLVELIQKHTDMKVQQAEDGMRIQPDHVYVMPPNRMMTLSDGTLQLETWNRDKFPLLIDAFFRSLAEGAGSQAAGIVFSGTGTDGTLGLRAIKEVGGLVIAQDPKTAKYASMPRSAIDTGLVDFILAPAEIPGHLDGYVSHTLTRRIYQGETPIPANSPAVKRIFELLLTHTGYDFSQYKPNTIHRRIGRRMALNQIDDIETYVRHLERSPGEVNTLFRDMLISVSSFFREPEAFDSLEANAIIPLLRDRDEADSLRAWVPACATGEEAYSIAILIREQMERLQKEIEVQIFATDIDDLAVQRARDGVYPKSIAADISPARLERYFVEEEDAYEIAKPIRKMVIFAVQSVIKDPPFSHLDLVSCRNLLIYLGSELQEKAIRIFHYALDPGGYLFLGTSESLSGFDGHFKAVDRANKLFRRAEAHTRSRAPHATLDWLPPDLHQPEGPKKEMGIREYAERTMLEDYTPASVIIDVADVAVYIHGRTGRYLEPAAGESSMNLVRMAREGLRRPLLSAIHDARSLHREVKQEGIRVKTNGGYQQINLIVKPAQVAAAGSDLLWVIFEDVAEVEPEEAVTPESDDEVTDTRAAQLEQELRLSRERLQTTVEELETTNEELKSTNEELQSSNEELHTTNEELETSRQELVTVNAELQDKVMALSHAQSDLENLLASTEIAIIFLDKDLCVRRFTPPATAIVNLIEADIGRPLAHIASTLEYDDMVEDAQRVQDTLSIQKTEVQAKDGGWYQMQIRPYRTVDDVIDGVVITFTDIIEQKELQEELRKARDYAQDIVATVREPLLVLDGDLRITTASRSFRRFFKVTQEDVEGKLIYKMGNGQWDIPELRELLEHILPEDESFEDFEVQHDFPGIGERTMLLNARRIVSQDGQPHLILLAMEEMENNEKE